MSNVIIFGGTGFFGLFMAIRLSEQNKYNKIFLYDHEEIDEKDFGYRIKNTIALKTLFLLKAV